MHIIYLRFRRYLPGSLVGQAVKDELHVLERGHFHDEAVRLLVAVGERDRRFVHRRHIALAVADVVRGDLKRSRILVQRLDER